MNTQHTAIETKIDQDNIEYTFGTYRGKHCFIVRDLDANELVSRSDGPEAVIRAKFDSAVSKVKIVTTETTGAAALNRIFG